MPTVLVPTHLSDVDVPDGITLATFDGDGDDLGDLGSATLADIVLWVPPYGKQIDIRTLVGELPNLRWIQAQSAGTDALEPEVPDGVGLCSARGVHDAAVAELGVALMIDVLRGVPDFVRAQERATWLPFRAWEALADRTVMILGYGSIGEALERRLDGFETTVVRVAGHARDGVHAIDDVDALLPDVDVVVLLAPLTDATRHLVDAAFLAHLKDGAVVVNLARGPVVDTDALLAELTGGRLRAALDVTDPEPLPADHPLWSAPNVLITPHVAGGTTAMLPRMSRLLARQLRHLAAGEPLDNKVVAPA